MTIEVSAKKVQDAIDQGLAQLGVSLDEVNVEVVDAGGFLRKAKVRLTVEDKTEKAEKAGPAVAEKPAAMDGAEKRVEEKPAKTEKPAAKKPVTKKAEKSESVGKSEKPVAAKGEAGEAAEKPSADKPAKASLADKPKKPAAKKPAKPANSEETGKEKAECTGETSDEGAENAQAEQGKTKRRERKRHWGAEEREAAERAKEFVKKTVELMGFEGVTVEFDAEDPEIIEITAPEGDDSLIIGRHGETLSSLTYLAETCAIAEKCRVGVVVDCNGYRARRAASLTAMARRRAHECAAKQRKIKLEAMDRTDRRTIHMALADDAYVTTESEGKEPYRCVVLVPKEGVRPEPSKRDRGERGGRDRRDRKERGERNAPASAPQKRASFNVNIHGFVGHNDAAEREVEGEKAPDVETENKDDN